MTTYRRWLIAIILIAFAVRLHNLTFHSLWFDEAVSVHWARQSVPRILEVGFSLEEDRLPPLYYLTLKGWGALAGFGEFAVRLPSVLYGVLLVAAVAALARRLFASRRVALMAAALAAANPFLVWYSQEARMYAPAVFFGALAVWAWLNVCCPPNQQTSKPTIQPARRSQFTIYNSLFTIIFLLSAVAALYSHLYAGFLLPALGLWTLIAYPRRWRLWGGFALAGLAITLAYAPILQAIWRFSAEAAPGNPLAGLGGRAWVLLAAFTVWRAPLPPWLESGVPLAVALFALLAFLPQNGPRSRLSLPRLLAALLLVTPFVIANLLLSRNHLAFFGERYFIVMLPWLLILAAAGAERAGAWLRDRGAEKQRSSGAAEQLWSNFTFYALRFTFYILPFLLLFGLTVIPLPGQYSNAAAKEAWRQSVAQLARLAGPQDAILIHPDWVRYPFQFYFNGPGQTYAAFSAVTAQTELEGPLQGVIANHPLVWLVQSHVDGPDPERRVEQWFAARYPLVTELYPPGISLKGYAPGYRLPALPPEATPTDIQFDNGMRVAGFHTETRARAADSLFHPPSGWLHVTLYWQAARPIETDATPVVTLVGPEGIWGAGLERPGDALKFYLPSQWTPGGEIVRQDVDVNLNPATPPGTYSLHVGLQGYDETFPLATVEIR